jgi:hypothetical protein
VSLKAWFVVAMVSEAVSSALVASSTDRAAFIAAALKSFEGALQENLKVNCSVDPTDG